MKTVADYAKALAIMAKCSTGQSCGVQPGHDELYVETVWDDIPEDEQDWLKGEMGWTRDDEGGAHIYT